MTKYKAMSYSELADHAGVNRRTLYRWLKDPGHQRKLHTLGVIPKAKALPPAAVKYICQSFAIDVE